MQVDRAMESFLSPADWARRRALMVLGGYARVWASNREVRVCVVASLIVLWGYASATLVPLWVLALGPIVLGVAHVLGDIRYLWVRPGLHRRALVWLAAGIPLVIGAVTAKVFWGLIAAAGALIIARTTMLRRCVGLVVVLPLAVLAWRFAGWSELIFAHLHNFVAILLWWIWRPRVTRLHWIPLSLFMVASTALVLGSAEPCLRWIGTLSAPRTADPIGYHLSVLAPFAEPEFGFRLVLLFVFAQAVHYGVWLRLVPEEDRPRRAPRTFVGSYRALRDDFGLWPLVVVVAIAMVFVVWGLVDLAQSRTTYLRIATFHGQLEFAGGMLLWAEGCFGRHKI